MLLRMQSNSQPEEQLHAVLERARTAGFLGPGPLRVHSDHARAFGDPIPNEARRLLDLGSGGGLPGLPLFVRLPRLGGVLLDASEKRCAFLSWAVAELGLLDRVSVRRGRAEELAYDPELRASFDVVTCRGFGPPAASIEGAIGFLADRGRLVISEPPAGRVWSEGGLAAIGLRQVDLREARQHSPTPDQDMRLPLTGGTKPDAAGDRSGINTALVVAFERFGPVPKELPRPLRRQRSRPLRVVVTMAEEGKG